MTLSAYLPLLTLVASAGIGACATLPSPFAATDPPADSRRVVVARAQLWNPIDVSTMNLKDGPQGKGAFPFRATVTCDYLDKSLGGQSPKFACLIGKDDEVKVKYGGTNGEVYGEVLATRLLWALGFGADRMYPVDVICRGCPETFGGITRPGGESRFDPAVIERELEGEWRSDKPGWGWGELDWVDPEAGGAARSQRDALKLLAVFLQHTDSKPEQQRIICVAGRVHASRGFCDRPFLMISDVGLTFGRANRSNANETGSVNLLAWRQTPVWKDAVTCTGNLPISFTGTLDDPVISEEGRRFLASLLTRLSDRQIRDLFEAARVQLRLREPGDASSGFGSVDEWVEAFKDRRAQITERRCS
jgi:hypothetical protein